MKSLVALLFICLTFQVSAQQKTILVFNLETHSVDSLPKITIDTTITAGRTPYYTGSFDTLTEALEQVPPVTNLYPNSQFTCKKTSFSAVDISGIPSGIYFVQIVINDLYFTRKLIIRR